MECYKCKEENPRGTGFCQNCGNDLSTLRNPPPKKKKSDISHISPDAKCPTCGSNNLQRFSPGNKVVKIAAFGVFGLGDVHKIFRCLNCGYKW